VQRSAEEAILALTGKDSEARRERESESFDGKMKNVSIERERNCFDDARTLQEGGNSLLLSRLSLSLNSSK